MGNSIANLVLPKQLVLGAKAIINDKDPNLQNDHSSSEYRVERLYGLLGLNLEMGLPSTRYIKRFKRKVNKLGNLSDLSTEKTEVYLKELFNMSNVIKDRHGPKYFIQQ